MVSASRLVVLSVGVLCCIGGQARAQWWVGGDSYSLRVDKYDSFYGEARPIRWSVERPPGVHWLKMLAPKREIHARRYQSSNGYPAVYQAGYPSSYYAGVGEPEARYYRFGYPVGYPVDHIANTSQMLTWRPPVVQVDPQPGDERRSEPFPADIPPPVPATPANGGGASGAELPGAPQR